MSDDAHENAVAHNYWHAMRTVFRTMDATGFGPRDVILPDLKRGHGVQVFRLKGDLPKDDQLDDQAFAFMQKLVTLPEGFRHG
jgi:hypothetical protein